MAALSRVGGVTPTTCLLQRSSSCSCRPRCPPHTPSARTPPPARPPPPAPPTTSPCSWSRPPTASLPPAPRGSAVLHPHSRVSSSCCQSGQVLPHTVELCVIKCANIQIRSGDFPAEQLGNHPTEFEYQHILWHRAQQWPMIIDEILQTLLTFLKSKTI